MEKLSKIDKIKIRKSRSKSKITMKQYAISTMYAKTPEHHLNLIKRRHKSCE